MEEGRAREMCLCSKIFVSVITKLCVSVITKRYMQPQEGNGLEKEARAMEEGRAYTCVSVILTPHTQDKITSMHPQSVITQHYTQRQEGDGLEKEARAMEEGRARALAKRLVREK